MLNHFLVVEPYFFYLESNFNINEFYINDVNEKLINVYNVIKYNCDKLIKGLEDISSSYFGKSQEQSRGLLTLIKK